MNTFRYYNLSKMALGSYNGLGISWDAYSEFEAAPDFSLKQRINHSQAFNASEQNTNYVSF